jgi:steroid delta-isomerase-like uncharacterized protein
VWNQRRFETIDELMTPESVGHTESGDLHGPDDFRRFQSEILSAFPDFHLSIESMVADGDDVVIRWQASGKHDGDWLGAKASYQQITFPGITWHRFKAGKLIEGWNFWNHVGTIQKLGG